MENLPRNMAKDLVNFKSPQMIKRKNKKVLIQVLGNGRTKIVKWRGFFKFCMATLLLLSFLSSGTAGLFYYLYQQTLEENNRLKTDMADMVTVQIPEVQPNSEKILEEPEPEPAKEPPVEDPPEEQPAEPEVEVEPEPLPAMRVLKPLRAAIENFKINRSNNKQTIKLSFDIKKIYKSKQLKGRVFAVLKPSGDFKKWLILPPLPPSSELTAGRPQGDKAGKTFAISRFRTIKLETKADPDLSYKLITIHIFTRDGKLLLEKNYPVEF